jgi:DNA-directed RNA polymerase subunit omega
MARITVDDCLEKVGDDNRFALVHLTVARIKQRREGEPLLIKERKNKEVVMTLREIAANKVTFENIKDLPRLRREAEMGEQEAAEAATEEQDS